MWRGGADVSSAGVCRTAANGVFTRHWENDFKGEDGEEGTGGQPRAGIARTEGDGGRKERERDRDRRSQIVDVGLPSKDRVRSAQLV